MANRRELDAELKKLLGCNNVYFQPDLNVRLKYPCIVYQFAGPNVAKADDNVYLYRRRYNVTLIFRDPDSDLAERCIKHFRYCSYSGARYVSDNLYHDPLMIVY